MTSLYNLSGEYLALASKLQDSEFDEQTIADTLEGFAGELEAKAVNVAYVVKNFDSDIEQLKQMEKQLSERRKLLESRQESVKKYLFDNMVRCGITEINSPYFALKIKKNPPSVNVLNDVDIPKDYYIQPPAPPPQLDNRKLLDDLKNGVIVNGVELKQNERLEIK
jgi:hypothetical protein